MSYFIFPVSMVPMVSLYSFFRVLTVSIVPIVSLKQNNFFLLISSLARVLAKENTISSLEGTIKGGHNVGTFHEK